MGKPRSTELTPIDWVGIEPHYRAGVRSIRAIAKQFGTSHAAIVKHADKNGWQRDLKPAIMEKADRLVATAAVTSGVAKAARVATDAKIVDAVGQQIADLRLEHQSSIGHLRRLVAALMKKAEAAIGDPEIFGRAWDVLMSTDEAPDLQVLRDMAELVASLPTQTKVLKDLAEAMHRVIGMEREAFGLNTAAGTDGLPMVIVKDFTGRGDPDSPFASLNSTGGA